ncbi:Protein AIM2 [Cytospora mali]|uniref:Protein AIM2 n=1 Tax=Cytospora mali TaxID=578113 RepID=A0A194V0V9_CYTMA|nr:Protein AIM2 [Valsa mali var. pyri (nom. inval.)]
MSLPSGISPCCLKGFQWTGTPTGTVGKLAANDAYIVGDNRDVAIMLIHDLFGWEFPNIRLLADHISREAGATVYVPDFFGGEHLPWDPIVAGDFASLGDALPRFVQKNGRGVREPELFECARALRRDFRKVGAAGFCYGGWACFRLASAQHQPPLVDCVSIGHPSLLTAEDVDGVGGDVPIQMLAPEIDLAYTAEMKLHTFTTLQRLNVPFEYRHFPRVEHACFIRGSDSEENPGERDAMIRGKNAIVGWMREWLHGLAAE